MFFGRLIRAYRRVLLLDEPTAGMSPEETVMMMDLVVRLAEERTIVLVEHKMKLVMGISHRIIVLHHGELLADGTPDMIRTIADVRRVYLGPLLNIKNVGAWYGQAHVLQGVNLDVGQAVERLAFSPMSLIGVDRPITHRRTGS
jgi:ABC-type branched-subunit amino acid transport system ATPase component